MEKEYLDRKANSSTTKHSFGSGLLGKDDKIEEFTKKLEDYMSDDWKLEVRPGITFDKRTIMRYWDIIDTMDSAITTVRRANFEFKSSIDDKELLSLQMKIRKEKGRIRKNFPMMKWYLGGS